MAMKEAELRLRRTGKPEDQKYADIIATVRGLRGGDVYGETQPTVVFASIDQAVEAYKSQPHTPELVTQVHQTIWRERGKLVSEAYDIPPCPYTQKELQAIKQEGKRVGYLPIELATQENRHLLGKMFPEMKCHGAELDNGVTNDKNPSGWFCYEINANAPRSITERGELLNLSQYMVAGEDSKDLTGRYLDEPTTAPYVLLGSYMFRLPVNAKFSSDGRLWVCGYLWPGSRSRYYTNKWAL